MLPISLRTWKRTPRQAKHLTARERKLLAAYDQALPRADWRVSRQPKEQAV
jgi:hypothetical protein